MSRKTKNLSKKSKTRHTLKKSNDINVYAKNMIYMKDSNKYKLLLTKLTEALNENQWIKYSKNKYKPIKYIDNNKINKKYNYTGFKPVGSYYSKGSWLFHEDNCCNLDWEIILIEVDYKTITLITGKEPYKSPISNQVYKDTLSKFMKKYGVKSSPPTNNKKYQYNSVNWTKLYKKYDGFAMYPYPEYEMIQDNKNKMNELFLYVYDVETLVLWDHMPVIKYYNLGTIKNIIEEFDNTKKHNKNYLKSIEKFIKNLIKKINKINNISQ